MIHLAFGVGLVVGTFIGVFAAGLWRMAARGDGARVVRQCPPMDKSPRPVITPNPPPRVVKR